MKTLVTIQNLKCEDSVKKVITQLNKLDGISNVKIEADHTKMGFDCCSHNAMEGLRIKLTQLGYTIID